MTWSVNVLAASRHEAKKQMIAQLTTQMIGSVSLPNGAHLLDYAPVLGCYCGVIDAMPEGSITVQGSGYLIVNSNPKNLGVEFRVNQMYIHSTGVVAP